MNALKLQMVRLLPVLMISLTAVRCGGSVPADSTTQAPAPKPASASHGVICNKFQIQQARSGDTLTVSLDTDLPDFTDIMVSVSRSYFRKNNRDEYPLDYLDEKSTVGKWRQPRQIRVSHHVFNEALHERQKATARAGIGGELDHVASEVVVSFTVPINQTNEAVFGPANRNLRGAATTTSGNWRLVRAEGRMQYPMDKKASGPQWGNREALLVGNTYRLSRETPLMRDLFPSDPYAAIASIRRIPSGGMITIREVGTKDRTKRYRVEARDRGNAIGNGWMNSDALIGQELELER